MSFDVLAPHYRWMELVLAGEKLQRCRTAFLSRHIPAKHVLILGEGNGRFLAECRKTLPSAMITCVDSSARMLALARQRLAKSGSPLDRIDFVLADALSWVPPKNMFDLVVTHFFLDCFRPEQLDQLFEKLAPAASQDASWFLADFQIPEAGPGRRRAQIIHRVMYSFFRVVTRLPAQRLTPPDPFLRAHRFVLQERVVSDWGLLRSDLWQRVSADH